MTRAKRGFDWDTQLEVGRRGEALLMHHHPELVPAPDGERRFDLVDPDAHLSVEVKTDTYSPLRTANFFMERHTRTARGLLDGGPWRALAHGVDRFVYLYVNASPPEAFWFADLSGLCATLDEHAAALRIPMRSVYNRDVRAEGYLVPRELIQRLYERRVYDGT